MENKPVNHLLIGSSHKKKIRCLERIRVEYQRQNPKNLVYHDWEVLPDLESAKNSLVIIYDFERDDKLIRFILCGRHFNISTIVLADFKDETRIILGNIDYLTVFPSQKSQNNVYRNAVAIYNFIGKRPDSLKIVDSIIFSEEECISIGNFPGSIEVGPHC